MVFLFGVCSGCSIALVPGVGKHSFFVIGLVQTAVVPVNLLHLYKHALLPPYKVCSSYFACYFLVFCCNYASNAPSPRKIHRFQLKLYDSYKSLRVYLVFCFFWKCSAVSAVTIMGRCFAMICLCKMCWDNGPVALKSKRI